MTYSEVLEEICERIKDKIKATILPEYNQGLFDAWQIILEVREEALKKEIRQ